MTENTNSRKNILVVDDDEVHLSTTKLLLKDEYEVLMAKSGEEALEFLSKSQIVPDVILLDILMPMMDGWVVFDKISGIADLKFTPIIFYTSLDEETAKEKAYELGVFDFITKPCAKSILLSKIGDALQKAELKKQQYSI